MTIKPFKERLPGIGLFIAGFLLFIISYLWFAYCLILFLSAVMMIWGVRLTFGVNKRPPNIVSDKMTYEWKKLEQEGKIRR